MDDSRSGGPPTLQQTSSISSGKVLSLPVNADVLLKWNSDVLTKSHDDVLQVNVKGLSSRIVTGWQFSVKGQESISGKVGHFMSIIQDFTLVLKEKVIIQRRTYQCLQNDTQQFWHFIVTDLLVYQKRNILFRLCLVCQLQYFPEQI